MKMKTLGSNITRSLLIASLAATTVLATGCSNMNLKLPSAPDALSTVSDVADLRNKFSTARDNWKSFYADFDITLVDTMDKGAIVKSMQHLEAAFDHADTLVHDKSLDATGKTKAVAEVPAFYKSARQAVIDLRSVYKRNELKLTDDQKTSYRAVYADLKALDDNVQGNIATVENLDQWLEVIADITTILRSLDK